MSVSAKSELLVFWERQANLRCDESCHTRVLQGCSHTGVEGDPALMLSSGVAGEDGGTVEEGRHKRKSFVMKLVGGSGSYDSFSQGKHRI